MTFCPQDLFCGGGVLMLKAENTIYFPYGPTETVHIRACILHPEQWVATFPLHKGLGLKHLERYWKQNHSFNHSPLMSLMWQMLPDLPLSISTYCKDWTVGRSGNEATWYTPFSVQYMPIPINCDKIFNFNMTLTVCCVARTATWSSRLDQWFRWAFKN